MAHITCHYLSTVLLLVVLYVTTTKGQSQCGDVTSEKVFSFWNPDTFTSKCTFGVNVSDSKVTQLRLDFIVFSIAQPTKRSDFSTQSYECHKDSFTVTSLTSDKLPFGKLCGDNSGQHIYVPVNAVLSPELVQLTFDLSSLDNTTKNRLWDIKITQLDCDSHEGSDICAPDGCLQYYPAPSGTFESFNYNGGMGHYQGLLNYAICFKRHNSICNIQYNAVGFQLASNIPLDEFGTGCYQPVTDVNVPGSQDYLFIPDATTSTNVRASLWCGSSLLDNLTTTYAPGPMYVFFHTDACAYEILNGGEIGFRINYQESSSEC